MYLHGFASSGASGTVELLRREFWEKADASHRAAVVAPDIPLDPLVALPMLKAFAARERPCWSVVQNVVPARMNSGRLRWMMPLRCWMGSLRVRMYLG